jgi:hypothetical protein
MAPALFHGRPDPTVKTRELHKLLGLILLLPFIAWSATAVFFLVRPAYEEAYARLEVKQYPLSGPQTFAIQPDWLEFRYFRSVLGPHLLVRREAGWAQLDPVTLSPAPYPDAAHLRTLVSDAMTVNRSRFGAVSELDSSHITTNTGVNIMLDWDTLSFTQEGRDTRWIGRVYSIHYLEWTGIAAIDKFLGLFGLFLLLTMTWTGAKLAFGRGSQGRGARASASHTLGRQESI